MMARVQLNGKAYGPWKTGSPQYLLCVECPEKK
jgi:hypothetical protein